MLSICKKSAASKYQVPIFGTAVHWQCFCRSRKLIPSLLQSGARQVTWSLSNVATPFWTKSLGVFKCVIKTWVPSEFGVLFDKVLREQHKWTQTIWLTSPTNDLASVIVLGTGKLSIACIMDLERVTPEGVI